MSLLQAQNLSLSFGLRPLLKAVNFSLEKGEKIALLGRNGEGKSSLLKVIAGEIKADEGKIITQQGFKIAYLPQDPPLKEERTALEIIKEGSAEIFNKLKLYNQLASSGKTKELEECEAFLNANNGWNIERQIETLLQQFQIEGNKKMLEFSGGWRRRIYLARALAQKPDLLLLDEPTNHLDISSIIFLEELFKKFAGAIICVSHDRRFLKNLAQRFWELDRGNLLDIKGSYERFLRTKAELFHAEELENLAFDKKLAQEEVWIRKGIEARRTRNEGRVKALKEMRRKRAERIDRQKIANLRLDLAQKSGKQVIVAENLCYKNLIKNFCDIVERGEKIALIGANGVGKTTLIKLLLGQLEADSGKIERGTQLEIAYFDQLRELLNPEETVRDSVGEGKEYVEIGGAKKHIASYLQDFLFPPQRFQTPISALSGGERARLMLAKLFLKPANFLVLDEPTNDLDIETLELLEELLSNFQGTVLIASHDREFLDEVVNRSWVFEQKKERILSVVGGFTDWLEQGGKIEDLEKEQELKELKVIKENPEPNLEIKTNKKKLSYKFQRELDELPEKIENLEKEIQELNDLIQSSDFQSWDFARQKNYFAELENKQNELENLLNRWEKLEMGEI